MSKKSTVLTIVLAAVLLLIVVAIVLNGPNKEIEPTTTETTQTETSPPTEQTPTDEQDEAEVAATITYTDDGFAPASVTVKSGDRIRIENKSSSPLSFNSDDHPSHTEQDELNVGSVPEGGSREFTVTETGTWGYHNHDNSSHGGEIVVE